MFFVTRARFPVPMRTALTTVLFVLLTAVEDHTVDLVLVLFKVMTRLPSLEILSWATLSSDSVMGLSLLATQTGVKTGSC